MRPRQMRYRCYVPWYLEGSQDTRRLKLWDRDELDHVRLGSDSGPRLSIGMTAYPPVRIRFVWRLCMTSKMEELSFTYFPENYRWSHGLLIGLNMAPWGGAEIGEVNRIGLRLKTCVGDDDAWFREWTHEARI